MTNLFIFVRNLNHKQTSRSLDETKVSLFKARKRYSTRRIKRKFNTNTLEPNYGNRQMAIEQNYSSGTL